MPWNLWKWQQSDVEVTWIFDWIADLRQAKWTLTSRSWCAIKMGEDTCGFSVCLLRSSALKWVNIFPVVIRKCTSSIWPKVDIPLDCNCGEFPWSWHCKKSCSSSSLSYDSESLWMSPSPFWSIGSWSPQSLLRAQRYTSLIEKKKKIVSV